MTKDMTVGKPLGLILRFCGPMVLGNILQQLYSMVDTVIVGRYLGTNALAGVGATGAISFLVIGFATGICTGLSIPVAQAFGAGDYRLMRKYIANSNYLGAVISVLLTILTMFATGTILHWMKTPDDIYQYSYDYIIVIFGGILTSVLYNSLAAILRAVGDSKSPILFLAISSVLNIVLDLVFLVGLHSGVAGAGYATVISQGISGMLCLFYLYKKFEIMRFQQGECRLELKRCSRLLSIGLPMALQFSITASGAMVMQAAINLFGSVAVAAFTAASKVQNLVTQGMMSMGQTMASYGGQNYGKGDYHRLEKGVRSALLISVIYSLLAAAAVGLFLRPLLSLFFSGDIDMASLMPWAKTYIYMCAVFYIPLSTIFIFRNIMQGCGYGFLPMMGGVSELIARLIVSMAAMKLLSYPLACFADPAAWIAAAVFTGVSYLFVIKKIGRELKEKTT